MQTPFKTLVLMVVINFLLSIGPLTALGQSGYDQIVDDLTSRQTSSRTRAEPLRDPLGDVKIYFGLGWVNSFYQPTTSISSSSQWHPGMILTLGIDLFSRHWLAEGSIKNFGNRDQGAESFTLRDFDLKLIHTPNPYAFAVWRWGIGVGGRYLDHTTPNESFSSTTPHALAITGLSFPFSSHFRVGADVIARTALIQDTIDKNSMDFSLKLDTFF